MSTSGDGGKPIQTGLADMGDIAFYKNPSELLTFTIDDIANYPRLFSEVVLNVTWAQLHAVENGPIETAFIQAVTAYNAQHGTDLGIELRVWGDAGPQPDDRPIPDCRLQLSQSPAGDAPLTFEKCGLISRARI